MKVPLKDKKTARLTVRLDETDYESAKRLKIDVPQVFRAALKDAITEQTTIKKAMKHVRTRG